MKKNLCALITTLLMVIGVQADTHSALWGIDGEHWTPESRLPDFSFAGYHRGEKPLPALAVTHNVRDFGAVGDGKTDDTEAFQRALAEVKEGVILVPEGRYVITNFLAIDKPNLVLRGEDPAKSILYCPKPLNDIKENWGATTSGQRTSNYSWSGGFISIRGSFQSKPLANISGPAKRGARTVIVDDGTGLSVGQEVELRQVDDVGNSLANHLYSGDPRISMEKIGGRTQASLVARITKIDGAEVTLDRPLRCDVDAAWKPTLHRFDPTVTESGIENLRFEFPNTPYQGHFTELGFNAIAFAETAHCWARNIHIHNADSGGFISGYFNTIDGVVFTSDREEDKNRKSKGHHGITLGGNDNFLTNFDFRMPFIHDITVTHCSGNVISNGRGVDLALDHHRRAPYENLFTNIDAGRGARLWNSGGGQALGAHCGARGTFWNIRSESPIAPPDANFGPWSMNLVGVKMNVDPETNLEGRWHEHTNTGDIQPKNLHEAQLERRLSGGTQQAGPTNP
ncbi:MAG: glycosyl hydrolase family 28-related protein [Candidatus Hydrogenedentes bacterium]|nr:glycosyl hydrolase family 28-related protein [Candidatus Hydrogenedentota bacterium]